LLSATAFSVQAVASGPALFVKVVSGWRAVVALVFAMIAMVAAGVLLAVAANAMLRYSPGIRADGEVKSYFVAIVAMGLFQVVLPARLLEVMSRQPPRELVDGLDFPVKRRRIFALPVGVIYVGFAVWLMVRVFAG
jgi:hypothetical protein